MAMNWAYVAGIFDGEGNLCMPFGSNNSLLMSITQAGSIGIKLFAIVYFTSLWCIIHSLCHVTKKLVGMSFSSSQFHLPLSHSLLGSWA